MVAITIWERASKAPRVYIGDEKTGYLTTAAGNPASGGTLVKVGETSEYPIDVEPSGTERFNKEKKVFNDFLRSAMQKG